MYCDKKQIYENIYQGSKYAQDIGISWYHASGIAICNIPRGTHSIEIKYTYKAKDVVQQFNDVTVLRLKNTTHKFSKVNFNITLPKTSSIFQTNSKNIKVDKISNNQYSLEILEKLSNDYIELKIDKGIITQGKVIDKNIDTYNFLKLFINDKKENYILLLVLGVATLISFIAVMILTKKIKVTEYVREPDMLLDPIIAESIIDRKIGAKELIMSCIVELIYRKKLRNIGNDAVEIVDLNQVSEYEKDIINLIFNGKTKITFNEIKEIFINDANKTGEFYKKFKSIKQKIENKIYSYNIYSRFGDKILKILKIFSFLILIGVAYLYRNTLFDYSLGEYIKYILIFLLLPILALKTAKTNNKSKGLGVRLLIGGIILLLLDIIIIFNDIQNYLIIILGATILIILNIIIIKRTKSHVFTEYGKMEYAKVVGLKNYIVDYSLMEKRELDSVIIWDEYLAYSVAFGISNKVSRKFSENLMEANIIIQKIDKFLRM